MNEQKALMLGQEVWIGQGYDAGWRCWVTGENRVKHQEVFQSAEDAKKLVHLLAHWYLEEKHFCDCDEELIWVVETSAD